MSNTPKSPFTFPQASPVVAATPSGASFSFKPAAPTSSSSAPPLFGGGNQSGNSFATGSFGANTPMSSNTTTVGMPNSASQGLFGQMKPSAGGSGLFGAGPGNEQSASPFGSMGVSTGASGSGAPSVFGNRTVSTPAFGQSSSNVTPPPGSTTPAATNKAFFPLSMTSTTPAGPPPSTSGPNATNSQPFGKPTSTSIFGSASQSTSAPPSAVPSGQNAPTQGSNLFGSKPQTGGGLFGQIDNNKPDFSTANAGASSGALSATNTTKQDVQQTANKAGWTFGQTDTATGGNTATVNTQNGPLSAPAAVNRAPLSFPSTAQSGQVNENASTNNAGTSSAGLFPSLNATTKPTDANAASTAGNTGNLITNANANANANGNKSNNSQATAHNSTKTSGDNCEKPATTNNGMPSSTSGPIPTAQSRLKNKSMDDIMTRWAGDLLKYQKEFQQNAEKVAAWDRLLVENSDRISKLYRRTFQAERDTAEVERQLSAVESQQDELEQWLERYEKDVEELTQRHVGTIEGIHGPDHEREQT